MDDLVAFLRARLDEDERIARAVPVVKGCAPPAHWDTGADLGGKNHWVLGTSNDIDAHTAEAAEHIARHDPAHVLGDIEVKRRMISQCEKFLAGQGDKLMWQASNLARRILADLTLPYADHREYREEWRSR
ncbi:DUF6221 family protein [Nonomuraea sp. ATR24]|uniref:DUF6221 family protein n=1 Tax=Nonomuraea sp. ATR24 TaxID=1676744 RepID=UPI0035C20466